MEATQNVQPPTIRQKRRSFARIGSVQIHDIPFSIVENGWMNNWSSTPKQLLNNCEQWVCKSKQHCNTNADQERSIDQTSQKEHFWFAIR
jgi:hypothetical protein